MATVQVQQPTVQPVVQSTVGTSPGVVQRLSFSSEYIKRLDASDFNLNAREFITLRYDDCILVLFYVENTESYQLANIWSISAAQVVGPAFAAINMVSDRRVAEAFTRLRSDGNNPLQWAALRQYPFILVYRKGWPTAVYNGPREVQALIDYAMTLACQAAYYETEQIGGSMQAEGRIEMGPYQPYRNIPGQPPVIRQVSTQYGSENPIRGFNPTIPVVVTNSAQAQQATAEIRTEEVAQQREEAQGVQASLTESGEAAPAPTPEAEIAVPATPTGTAVPRQGAVQTV